MSARVVLDGLKLESTQLLLGLQDVLVDMFPSIGGVAVDLQANAEGVARCDLSGVRTTRTLREALRLRAD